ncbi:MAG: gliding motility-associated C-terminal domain-containing protein, partial [Mangrovibacterium sp.]
LIVNDLNATSGTITLHSEMPTATDDMSHLIDPEDYIIYDSQTVWAMSVTDKGCYGITSTDIEIELSCNYEVAEAVITDADCHGASTGAIEVSIANNTPLSVSFTYQWSSADGTVMETRSNIAPDEPVSFSNIPAGTYTLEIVPDNGCPAISTSEMEYTVTEPNPVATPTGRYEQEFCSADNPLVADLVAYANGENTISWYDVQTGGTALNIADNLKDGTNTYYAVQDSVPCGESPVRLPVEVTVHKSPILSITNPGTVEDLLYFYDLDTLVADANNTVGTLSYHTQEPADASDMSHQITDEAIYDSQEIWVMKVTDEGGCYDITSVEIEIKLSCRYEIDPIVTHVTCFNEGNGSIDLAVINNTPLPAPNFTYKWSNGKETSMINQLTPGKYSVIITPDNGCDSLVAEYEITEPEMLEIRIEVTKHESREDMADGIAEVTATGGTPGYEYLWDDAAGQISNIATGLSEGTYTVTVTDANGCETSGEANVQIFLFFPEGFSPNNDGINDRFVIPGLRKYPDAKLEVYTRWNVLVYSKEHYGNEELWGKEEAWWDGRPNSKKGFGTDVLPSDNYIYILKYNGRVTKSTVFINW